MWTPPDSRIWLQEYLHITFSRMVRSSKKIKGRTDLHIGLLKWEVGGFMKSSKNGMDRNYEGSEATWRTRNTGTSAPNRRGSSVLEAQWIHIIVFTTVIRKKEGDKDLFISHLSVKGLVLKKEQIASSKLLCIIV